VKVVEQSRRVRVGGREIRYRQVGSGPPAALLVPGLGLSSRAYRPNLDGFGRAGVGLVVPDLPGYSSLVSGGTGWRVRELAELLAAFGAAVAPGGATWIGHSIGWQTAARVAAVHPELVSGLVLAAPIMPAARPARLRQLGRFLKVAWKESWRVRRTVARDYLCTSPAVYAGTWHRFAADDVLTLLPGVRCRALVVVGTRDPMLDAEERARLLCALPQAQLEWVSGGTHGVPFGRPDAFNRLVLEFVGGR
jgi:pimeloyl-ACP methyl ester carboxylesterase